MKKICLLLILVIYAGVCSCSLEETAYQPDETYIVDARMSERLLQDVYRLLGTDGIYRYNLPFLFNLTTDEAKAEGSGLTGQRLEGSNAFSTTSTYVQQTWQALYSAIYGANHFIEVMERKMPGFSEKDQEKCALYVAEARALRGLLYFELVRWFGYVPLVLTTADAERPADTFVQAEPEDVYEQIEADLQYAADVLPYADEDQVRGINSFRISKGGVLGLLTKVYATWAGYPLRDESKWEDAVRVAEELITSGKHGLLTDFKQLWYNSGDNVWDPKESLLELSYWSPLLTTASCGRVGNVNGVRAAEGSLGRGQNAHNVFYYLNPTFLTSWKDHDKDKRFELSYADYQYTKVGRQKYGTGKVDGVENQPVSFMMAWQWKDNSKDWNAKWRKIYCYRLTNGKWDTEIYVPDRNNQVDHNFTNINWYLLRYAEVLLLYAEALNEVNKGPVTAAFEAVNMVRRRGFGLDMNIPSFVADLPAGLSYEEFRQAVRDERAWELVGEGHRRQDLIRWGIYYETVKATYVQQGIWHEEGQNYYLGGKYTQKNKHELLPIPQREVDLCGFRQNRGWN